MRQLLTTTFILLITGFTACLLSCNSAPKGEQSYRIEPAEAPVYYMEDQSVPLVVEAEPGETIIVDIEKPETEEVLTVKPAEEFNTEEYSRVYENDFKAALDNPLSTFSIDVDTASYSNVRRFLTNNQLPPHDAVRIEEFINYFNYDYPQPTDEHPFSISSELSQCPWKKDHYLVHIGLKGKELTQQETPNSNLVFLLDVSGSMNQSNKLPLLKSSLRLLINQLTSNDSIAIVVYAGAAGLVLPATPASHKGEILDALDSLSAGGSTAGSAGINLAYDVALDNFIKGGNNRVILATDGDFNVGPSSESELTRLIEEKREQGVFLTVLGFGMGNYKDSRMEQLADKGNGNYAYIDTVKEAQKVLVEDLSGTLIAIAKDVKIQIEFNPALVKAYRLVGYENRILNKEDFNDDTKDAGELGAGHTVTALYEIIPVGAESDTVSVDPLKYQVDTHVKNESYNTDEMMTVKLRYKEPDGHKSKLIVETMLAHVVDLADTDDNFRFSAAVAQFGLILRESKYMGDASFKNILNLATGAIGEDHHGYRSEFLQLVEISNALYVSE